MISRQQILALDELRTLLSGPSADEESALFGDADRTRAGIVGDEVHLRGLIEISNWCRCDCLYCGLRVGNGGIPRYRMTGGEILAAARLAKGLGYGTVVLQSAEDPDADIEAIAGIVREIKHDLGLAVTLSLGVLRESEFARLREAGADRYLLKHETANPVLFRKLKPGFELAERVDTLRLLRRLGYQIGSGCMVGLPGQTADDLAADLLLLRDLDIDMAGIGPFIPCPGTPLWESRETWPVESRIRTTYRMMALLRLLCPGAMIPVTTALSTLDPEAWVKGLQRGANVIMPNVGDDACRRKYIIYPGRAGLEKAPVVQRRELLALLESLGRRPGEGPGHSKRREGTG